MADRKRDYRREYEKRNERARAEGYRSYTKKRKAAESVREALEAGERFSGDGGYIDELLSEGDLFDDDEKGSSLLWRLFRDSYGKGSSQA